MDDWASKIAYEILADAKETDGSWWRSDHSQVVLEVAQAFREERARCLRIAESAGEMAVAAAIREGRIDID